MLTQKATIILTIRQTYSSSDRKKFVSSFLNTNNSESSTWLLYNWQEKVCWLHPGFSVLLCPIVAIRGPTGPQGHNKNTLAWLKIINLCWFFEMNFLFVPSCKKIRKTLFCRCFFLPRHQAQASLPFKRKWRIWNRTEQDRMRLNGNRIGFENTFDYCSWMVNEIH
jgi:hypothetical protein